MQIINNSNLISLLQQIFLLPQTVRAGNIKIPAMGQISLHQFSFSKASGSIDIGSLPQAPRCFQLTQRSRGAKYSFSISTSSFYTFSHVLRFFGEKVSSKQMVTHFFIYYKTFPDSLYTLQLDSFRHFFLLSLSYWIKKIYCKTKLSVQNF